MTDQDPRGELASEFDLLVSNPPYRRASDLPEQYRSELRTELASLIGRELPATTPLQALFLYGGARILREGGRAAFLVPSEVLETTYGRALKRYLLDAVDLRTIVLFDRQESLFEDAVTTSLILVFDTLPQEAQSTDPIRFVYIENLPDATALQDALATDEDRQFDWGTVRRIDQSVLDPALNWTNHFTSDTIDTAGLVPLSEQARVARGILTGDNGFFCVTRTDIDDWGIPKRYLAPVVRGTRTVPGYDYTEADWRTQFENDQPVSLIYHTEALSDHPDLQPDAITQETSPADRPTDDGAPEGILGYLQRGLRDEGVHEDGVPSQRDPWFVVDRREPPAILATYMTKGRHRFSRNDASARYLTNFLGIYPDDGIDDRERDALLAYLNSSLANALIQRRGRTRGDGLVKIEPGELADLPVIDLSGLAANTVDELATAFEQLRRTARTGGAVEAQLDTIDSLLRERLDLEWPTTAQRGR